MINICDKKNYEKIKKIIFENKLKNVYLYIDFIVYGCNSENTETLYLSNDDNIKLIIYRYYNSLQLISCKKLNDRELEELSNYIIENNFEMISGPDDLLSTLRLNGYKLTTGFFMKNKSKHVKKSGLSKLATKNDCKKIAELICSDEQIGKHYTTEQLEKQLIERMDKNCRNLIIKKDNEIASHIGTYAEFENLAVLGGLKTNEKYKGNGYGITVLKDITSMLLDEKKIPLLYCYNQKIVEIYKKNNWDIVIKCAKLEKIK